MAEAPATAPEIPAHPKCIHTVQILKLISFKKYNFVHAYLPIFQNLVSNSYSFTNLLGCIIIIIQLYNSCITAENYNI
jgi:hypothetical protein